jgi:urocanate hydratase
MQDNIKWIKGAQENKLAGSQARIIYADAEGRVKIAEAFNPPIAKGEIGTVILGRDHHDVSELILHTEKRLISTMVLLYR